MNTRPPPQIFNRRLVRMRRERSASVFSEHDFLHRRVMEDVVDRLETVKRNFSLALFAGASGLTEMLTPACGVGTIVQTDLAAGRLPGSGLRFTGDDEALALAPQRFDLIVNILTLHAVNDLVGALVQARHALKPDGLFIAAVFGDETLKTLRAALYQAETELTGGVSARFAPLAVIQDFGQALSRAGFALPAADVDKVRVNYANPAQLLRDLRGMGETSVLMRGGGVLRRDVMSRAMALFKQAGAQEYFDIIFMTGWAPDESQPKPLKPGSATASLADAVRNKT